MCLRLHVCLPHNSCIYSFCSRDNTFILFTCKMTYLSVDTALILILLANIFPFFFFVIFFYLHHTALNVSIQCVISPHRPNSKKCLFYGFVHRVRAINLDCSIQKRWLKGWKNLTSCADPSCPSMKEQGKKKIGSC